MRKPEMVAKEPSRVAYLEAEKGGGGGEEIGAVRT